MRFLKWFAASLLTLLILVLVAPFIALAVIDQATIKELAQEAVLESTGRTLTLEGDIGATISLQPTFTVENASLSNADWGKAEQFLSLESLSIGLSIPALLQGEIAIGHVALSNGALYLEKNSKGELNIPSDQEVAASDDEPEAAANPEIEESVQDKTSFTLGSISLSNIALHYHDLATGSKNQLLAESVEASTIGEDYGTIDAFTLVVDDKLLLSGDAELAPETLRLNAEGSTKEGGNSISLSASVKDPLGSAEISGDLSADISSPKHMPFAGIPALKLDANLSGTQDFIQLSNLAATLAGNSLKGNASIRLNEAKPRIQADLQADTLDLTKLSGSTSSTPASATAKASAEEEEDFNPSIVPNIPLPTAGLDAVNATINLAAQQLIVNDKLTLKNVTAKAKLNGGKLEVNPLNFGLNGGQIETSLTLNSAVNPPAMSLSLNGKNVMLGEFLKGQGIDDISNGKTNIALELSGTGKSLHPWLESANGSFYTHVDNAQYKTPQNLIEGYDLLSILRGKDTPKERLDIACFVSAAKIEKGKARISGTTLKTPVAFINANGEMVLKMMSLSLTLKARSNVLGFADAVPPILVYGPIDDLSTRVDTTSSLLTLGKWALGSATGVGLFALVGEQLTDKMGITADSNPCMTDEDLEKMKKADETNKENPIKSAEQSVKEIGKNAEDQVKAIRDGGKANIKDIEKDVKGLRDGLKGLLGK